MPFVYFAPAAKGLETLLADELRSLGADSIKATRAGVNFAGALAVGYRACLWSRLANRVLLNLRRFPAPDAQALYDGARAIDWDAHLKATGSLAVECTSVRSAITHTHYAALVVKDAIVDQFRARYRSRPSIDTVRPNLRVNLFLHEEEASIAIDLAGESLHRRGYRYEQVEAPLKENLAAAILLRADWPRLAGEGAALVDPMCGSGTLPIEAALIAGDIAPGLTRDYFGFLGWKQHDSRLWSALLEEARGRRRQGLKLLPAMRGYDTDEQTIAIAKRNAARAGVAEFISLEQHAFSGLTRRRDEDQGLVVVNPPYGKRLGEAATLPVVYRALGLALKQGFAGWRAAVMADAACGRYLGLRAHKVHKLYNGRLPCDLLHFELRCAVAVGATAVTPSNGAVMFANRLGKNLKHLKRWAVRESIACYRLFDADLPEYNLAIDLYENGARFAHVQEYEAPPTVDKHRAQRRLNEALAVIPRALSLPPENVFLKRRQRQRGGAQYERLDTRGKPHVVREGAYKFIVNLTDRLDTGLFLDQRLIRALVGARAAGRRFLNLFAYTGAATVYAAALGAISTTSVDISRTYLDWARRNLALNGIGGDHVFARSDALGWLSENASRRFGLIYIGAPTFSRSKRVRESLDIQRDHVRLLRAAAALLERDGMLIFTTHLRRFHLESAELTDFLVEDISPKTIPRDFARNPRIHRCIQVRWRPAEPAPTSESRTKRWGYGVQAGE